MTTAPEIAMPSVPHVVPAHQPPPPPPPLERPPNGSGGDAAPAAPGPPNASGLTFDDIAKHFNVPIAEAAAALGVCSSVLKRICRENGVVRWPYRKFLAGKTVDDIKKDAAKEKSKELSEPSKANSTATLSTLSSTSGTKDGPKMGRPMTAHPLNGPGLFQPVHAIPDYVDEFSYGFPAGGLALTTRQWWSAPDSEGSSSDDELFDESDGSDASSALCSLRRKAVQDGERSLRVGFSAGYRPGRRERSPLIKVFGSSLPLEWKP